MRTARALIPGLLAVCAVVMVGMVGATTASAATPCYKVVEKGTGGSGFPDCEILGGPKEYIEIEKLEQKVAPGVWCAKVKQTGAGNDEDSECTKMKAGGEYIEVVANPWWSIAGSQLETGKTAGTTGKSGVSRLWSAGLKVVIVCNKGKVAGGELIGGEPGMGKATSVKFQECSVREAKKESGKWEVGKDLSACKVKSPGAEPGEIVTNELVSTLAYYPGTAKEYTVVAFEPVELSFVTLEITGSLCVAKLTASVYGSVIAGTYPHGNLEATTMHWGFTVHEHGETKEMINLPEEYEEADGTKHEDTLSFAGKAAGFESMEEVELVSEKSFTAHT